MLISRVIKHLTRVIKFCLLINNLVTKSKTKILNSSNKINLHKRKYKRINENKLNIYSTPSPEDTPISICKIFVKTRYRLTFFS